MLLSIVEEILPALEAVAEFGQPPWRNDLDGRLECVESQLEADLVVALACAAVRDELAAGLFSSLDHAAGNDRTSERGAEQVDILVDGVGLDGREDELLDKFAPEIGKDEVLGTAFERLGASSLEVLLLTNIGHEGDDIVALIDKPCKDGGRVYWWRSPVAMSTT